MTQIIGFVGKKQSGKNTACNFILAIKIAELGISKSTRLSEEGEIEVTDIFNESPSTEEWFSFESSNVDIDNLFNNELGRYIKIYAFANKLKTMCVDLLGLKEEWVFGTDEQKNTPTHINWKDLWFAEDAKMMPDIPMTAREVLQFVGTNIFRSMYENVWVDACLRQIEQENPEIALISDVRFENEVTAIQNKGGYVIGLKRSPYKKSDKHASETEVEKCFDICDTVIDNSKLSIPKQNKEIYLAIKNLDNMVEII